MIQELKEELLAKYSKDELIDRFLLKIFNIDADFQRKTMPENFEYFAINSENNDDLAKLLNIPNQFVMVNKPGKLVLAIRSD